MDDAFAMRIVEPSGNCRCEAHRFVDWELLLAIQPRAQRFAFDERHDVEQQVARRAGVEQRQQVRMLEIRRDLNLRLKSIDADYRAEVRTEDLERDLAIVPEIAREIDLRHAAFA